MSNRLVVAVFGGNGYVGSHILKHMSSKYPHVELLSINRTGKPKFGNIPSNVKFIEGDITNKEGSWSGQLKENNVTACISCVGAFGSDDFMLKVNGKGNCNAIEAAKDQGVKKFVYISTVENNLPAFLLRGYFEGKRQAEEQLFKSFPGSGDGVVLRPGFIFGTRQVSPTLKIPLSLLGKPLEAILSHFPFNRIQHVVPGMKAVMCPPVSVEHVAAVASAAALGQLPDLDSNIVKIDYISSKGRSLMQ